MNNNLTRVFLLSLSLVSYSLLIVWFSTNFNLDISQWGSWGDQPWGKTYQDIIDNYSGSDEGSYVVIAKKYLDSGFFMNTAWPPALSVAHSILIYFFGTDIEPFKIFYFFNVIVWAFIFSLSLFALKKFISKYTILIFIIQLLIISSSTFSNFFMNQALILSDGFGFIFFILGLFLTFLSFNRKSIVIIAFAVLFFAIASLTRAVFDVFFVVLTILYFLYFIIVGYVSNYKLNFNFNIKEFPKVATKIFTYPLLAIIIFYHLILFPYKALYFFEHHEYAVSAKTKNDLWTQNFMTEQHLIDLGGGWIAEGGASITCNNNKRQCDIINECRNCYPVEYYKEHTYKTILTNPLWTIQKTTLAYYYWFSSPPLIGSKSSVPIYSFQNILALFLLLMYPLIGIPIHYFKANKSRRSDDMFSSKFVSITFICISVYAALIIPQYIFHFEVRYFYPIKLAVFFCIIFSLIYENNKLRSDHNE